MYRIIAAACSFTFLFLVLLETVWSQVSKEVNLSTPYHSIYHFLHYQQDETYDLARSALSLGKQNIPNKTKLAYQLKSILDGNGLIVALQKVPRDPNYTDSVSKEPIYVLFPERMPDIYLEKMGNDWVFSEHTISRIPALYDQTYPYLVVKLIEMIPGRSAATFLWVPVWKWLGALTILLLAIIVFILLYFGAYAVIHLMSNRYIEYLRENERKKKRLAIYFSLWVSLGLVVLAIPSLMLSVEVNLAVISFIQIVRTIVLILVLIKVSDLLFVYGKSYAAKTPGKLDDQIMPILERLVDFFIILGGLLHILHQLNVNVTALVAGVSIGGLALALAAQDTVKNIIGSAMIFIDKPFQIGDFVESSNYSGVVEEVGFRSVRLRNVDRSLISVPNGQVANDTIINLGLRPVRRIQISIGLTYNTPMDYMELYLQGLRDMIERHPMTSKTDYIIRFHDLGASSLNIFFRVYVYASTIAEEFKIREELVFGIVHLAQAVGVSFAFPSTSVYIEQEKAPESPSIYQHERKKRMEDFLEEFQNKVTPVEDGRVDSGA